MLLLLVLGAVTGFATGHLIPDLTSGQHGQHATPTAEEYCPVFYSEPPKNCRPLPDTFVDFKSEPLEPPRAEVEVLEDAFEALEVLQDEFFEADYGTWPSAIDWTGAVVETIISGMLTTLSKSLPNITVDEKNDGWKAKENLVSSYFAEIVNSYYGQDIVSLRGEAFDDMLWVVLGWVEAIKFVGEHADRHYLNDGFPDNRPPSRLRRALQERPWHGSRWIPAFAHRARIFWNLASRGWDTTLCGGGMVWDRRLNPYKNAITNELWISASISMYQYFPGDNITAPWAIENGFRKKDPAHLAAAIEGYRWLKNVNMLNHLGLFVDGFHISHQRGNTKCDVRDEMVYTYNQGVLLTAHRGLWTVTGSASYLADGHDLIQSVIKATGWHLEDGVPIDALDLQPGGRLPQWHGLGRGGIMEERCDASGTCSQDAQSFKGIFFHHLTAFCAPLDPITVSPGVTLDVCGYHRVKMAHAKACQHYLGWARHNALGAMDTRDPQGVFGMWWGAGAFAGTRVSKVDDGIDHDAANTTDYRNEGIPNNDIWGLHSQWSPGLGDASAAASPDDLLTMDPNQHLMAPPRRRQPPRSQDTTMAPDSQQDPNERGRGRSVETQMSGLAILRAYWELSQVGAEGGSA